jgi:hypothetical protein
MDAGSPKLHDNSRNLGLDAAQLERIRLSDRAAQR